MWRPGICFRQLGFRKTTVADIAATLGMSSANIYRFFPSKDALTEAICRNQLDLLVETARKTAAGPGERRPARRRRVLMALYRDLRDQMTNQKRVHEVVAVALEENWPAIDEFLAACMATVAGLVAQGQASGEFGPGDPGHAWARWSMAASAAIHHPTLIAHCSGDMEAEALVAFVLRALANKNPPEFRLKPGVRVMQLRPVAFALLPALLLAACGSPTQARRQSPERPVLVAEVHYAPRARDRVLPGVVKARIESDLAFRVPGKLAERFVDAGAVVRKGDPLARLR